MKQTRLTFGVLEKNKRWDGKLQAGRGVAGKAIVARVKLPVQQATPLRGIAYTNRGSYVSR